MEKSGKKVKEEGREIRKEKKVHRADKRDSQLILFSSRLFRDGRNRKKNEKTIIKCRKMFEL